MTEDPRQTRTREALAAAMLRLAADSTLTSISVASLCKEAGVHRTTFYGHASSLEEFAVDVLSRDVDILSTVDFDPSDPVPAYQQAMVALLDHLLQKREIFRTLLASPWAGALRMKLVELLRHRCDLAIAAFDTLPDVDVPPEHSESAAFISGALVGMMVDWVNSDETDVAARAARTQALMPVWWPVRPSL